MIRICDQKLFIFNLLLMSVVAFETFTGHEGGKVDIRCPYESKYETNDKYLCRGECPVNPLKDKVIPVESGSAAKDKRFSLTDDSSTHIFTVTITDLRTGDAGQYWCAVKTGLGKFDIYTEILLEVKPVSVVSGEAGQLLDITCRYERDVERNVKFICKGSEPSLCETSGIKVSSQANSNGRFSLRDELLAGVFTVTITDLTLEDSGKYWCGDVETGQQKKKWISVTDLNIYDVTSERTSPKPTTTASDHTSKPATAETASNRPVTSVFPLLSSSSSSPSVFSPPSNNSVSSKPEPGMMSFIMFILLVVIGILIGFGFSLFMYLRWRQKKEGRQPRDVVQGPTEHLPNGDMEPNGDATHVVSDYEEICNTLDHPDYSLVFPVFDEHDASVYALAQLPSSPSDNLNYSTVKFSATHHSDRTSDGQETCDYSTIMP